jgi:hypothetical protein
MSIKRLLLPCALGLLATLALFRLASLAVTGETPQSVNSGQHFLPPYGNARDRFGFGSESLTQYDVAQLRAGWYSNWGASLNPAHPDQLVYVQLVRFSAGADPTDPSQVTVKPDRATIAQIAAAHPGSLWLLSNEPDSVYQGNPILPEVYAVLHHDFSAYITGLDPSALIANGGIVQPTPCRLEYLDIALDTYWDTYSEPMPVDVWNIHAFILREVYGSWGASTPPGVDPSCGIDYSVEDAGDIGILEENIRLMRAWMREKGYQDRPLIISEYGILWPEWFAPQYTPARVSHFMTQTFELFLHARDPVIGYAADDYRLVQAWAWYSLSDDKRYNGYLFYSDSKALSPMGETYGAYTAAITDPLYTDLSSRLVGVQAAFSPPPSDTQASGVLTFSLLLTGQVGNLGKLPATNALVRSEILAAGDGRVLFQEQASQTILGRYDGVLVPPPLTASLAISGRHALRLSLDPEGWIDEPRAWNNVATVTLDILPDLALNGLLHRIDMSPAPSANIVLTASVVNRGYWPSPAVGAGAMLQTWPEKLTVATQALSLPAFPIGAGTNLTTHFALTAPDRDLYYVVVDVDGEDIVPEPDAENNRLEQRLPMVLSATLHPTSALVLTSASGAVQLTFPPDAVSTPTKITYTPLWPADLETGLIHASTVAFSLEIADAELTEDLVFGRPVTFTWHYDEQSPPLDASQLRVYRAAEDGLWYDAACGSYVREVDQGRLTGRLCSTGDFVFGSRYDRYLPLISFASAPISTTQEPKLLDLDSPGSRSPLRLP